ncbi:MAG: glycosyltransferase family 39 protein [Allomuricauda sp.]
MDVLKKYDAWAIFGLALLICTSFVGLYPIYILDEARNSEAAREMLASGNYVVPYFNGQLRTDKPPLHYFFMILGYKLFGINSLGARFFSGVFGALTILFTYWNVKKHLNPFIAGITVVILLSSLFFVQEFHLAVPDPYLIFFVTLTLFSFYNFCTTSKVRWLFPFYGGIALGMLTKGPIALVLPALIVPFFLVFKKDFNVKSILRLRPFLGLLLLFLIAAPWYYLVHIQTDGKWTKAFFMDHNVSRFGSGKEGHGGLFIITPLYVILGMLPFSVFAIQAFSNAWKVRKVNDFILFSFLVSAITIAFFSAASTKLPNYPMPCYPFVAVLIAFYLYQEHHRDKNSKTLTWSLIFLLLVGIILPVAAFLALGIEEQLSEIKSISLFLLLVTIAGVLGFLFYKRNKPKMAFWSMAGGWILMGLCLFGIIYPKMTEQSPVSLALDKIPEDSDIIVYKRFDSAFPINFQRTFEVLDSVEEIKAYLKTHPDAYILTNTRSEEDLRQLENLHLILEQKALFENHTTRVYTK